MKTIFYYRCRHYCLPMPEVSKFVIIRELSDCYEVKTTFITADKFLRNNRFKKTFTDMSELIDFCNDSGISSMVPDKLWNYFTRNYHD